MELKELKSLIDAKKKELRELQDQYNSMVENSKECHITIFVNLKTRGFHTSTHHCTEKTMKQLISCYEKRYKKGLILSYFVKDNETGEIIANSEAAE